MSNRHAFVSCAAFIAFSSLVFGQAKPPAAPANAKKDGDKEIATFIADMNKATAAKKDDDAIPKIDELVKRFEDAGPKDKKLIVESIAKNMDLPRLPEAAGGRDSKDEPEQPRIFQTTVVALSTFHDLGCEKLIATYERQEFKHSKRFRGQILKMVGKTEQASAVKFLMDKIKDKDDSIVVDAVYALGNYIKSKDDVKKPIIDTLVKSFSSAQGQAADPSTPAGKAAKDKYEILAPAMIDTLQKLSNQNAFREPREWESWWQKNKNKPLG
ncbi:MAG: hypothetical protein HY286_08705 [Planctomycetes bacterium]|nr:hypothetical protein [Planctomycetota bacterium]